MTTPFTGEYVNTSVLSSPPLVQQASARRELAELAAHSLQQSEYLYRANRMSICGERFGNGRVFLCRQLGCVFCMGGRVAKSKALVRRIRQTRLADGAFIL